MHISNKYAFTNIGQFLLDVFFILFSYIVSYIISSHFKTLSSMSTYIWVILVYLPIWVSSMGYLGMYNRTTFNYYDRIIRNVLFSSLISGMFVSSFMFFIKETMYSRTLYANFVILTMLLLLFERFITVYIIGKRRGNNYSKVIIVGSRSIATKFAYFIKKTNIKINVIGYVNVHSNEPFKSKKVLGNIEDLESILTDKVVDEVIFALPKDYMGEVEKHICICESMGITARMVLELYDLKIAKTHLSSVGTLPMLTFHTVSLNRFQLFTKRAMDIFGSLIGLFITCLVSIIIIPAIKLDSPGPAFFSQDRVGLNGRVFRIHKFRTMRTDAEELKKDLAAQNEVSGGLMFKVKSDPRITKLGNFLRRTSLDELPQFLNVLKGEMSLVGTRPPTLDEVSKYKTYHRRRISFKPGLTGMWQVSGRSSITDFDQVVRLDTQYIDEWTIWVDIKIIIKTVLVVFKKRGAY